MARIKSHPTPNPDSLKFTGAASFIASGMESFATPAEATGHGLGEALMAIPGVCNVFILPQFVTVTKVPAARWKEVTPAILAILESA